jgi:SAM-dependent methyltransferase
MRKQQQIWLVEHSDKSTLPTTANVEPTSGVVLFTNYLKENRLNFVGKAVDIGAGKGRNSVYLASLGFEVFALEYIELAAAIGKQLAADRKLEDRVHFVVAEIDKPWRYENDFFAIAIDSFASIDIETREGREICRDEMFRTLKPGGFAFINVCSADDAWEKELIANNPGPEPNSTLWPQNGKFQKDYDEYELRKFYKSFELMELREISKPAFKLGREGIATNVWAVLRKPT